MIYLTIADKKNVSTQENTKALYIILQKLRDNFYALKQSYY